MKQSDFRIAFADRQKVAIARLRAPAAMTCGRAGVDQPRRAHIDAELFKAAMTSAECRRFAAHGRLRRSRMRLPLAQDLLTQDLFG